MFDVRRDVAIEGRRETSLETLRRNVGLVLSNDIPWWFNDYLSRIQLEIKRKIDDFAASRDAETFLCAELLLCKFRG